MSQYPPQFPPGRPQQDHPQATTILILGICALVLCQIIGPFAWSMGNKALREVDASQGQLGGRDMVNIGRILGIVATVLMGLGVLAALVFVLIAVAASSA